MLTIFPAPNTQSIALGKLAAMGWNNGQLTWLSQQKLRFQHDFSTLTATEKNSLPLSLKLSMYGVMNMQQFAPLITKHLKMAWEQKSAPQNKGDFMDKDGYCRESKVSFRTPTNPNYNMVQLRSHEKVDVLFTCFDLTVPYLKVSVFDIPYAVTNNLVAEFGNSAHGNALTLKENKFKEDRITFDREAMYQLRPYRRHDLEALL